MSLEQVAGQVSQILMAIAWTIVFVLTMRAYLQFRLEKMTRGKNETLPHAVEIERSFFTFAFIFLPALMVWLPLIGVMPPDGPFYLPAVLAWLVILVFGSIQFHLGLTPTRAAWVSAISSAATGSFNDTLFKETTSGKEPGRNV